MHLRDDLVLLLVYQSCCFMGFLAPQQEDCVVGLLANDSDCGFGELLPSLLLVAIGFASSHSQDGVQHKDALLGPRRQVPMKLAWLWELEFDLLIIDQGLVHVPKTWRHFDALVDREAHSHGFSFFDVGILAQNDNSDVVEGSELVGVEDLVGRRIAPAKTVFLLHKGVDVAEIWTFDLLFKWFLPVSKLSSECLETRKYRVAQL